MTNPLSPAAQAVLDAAFPAYDEEHLYFVSGEQHASMIAAAALRAAADQVLIRPGIPRGEYSVLMRMIDGEVRAIAAELEQ